MAKAPKQISILCEDELATLPELVALAEKGHLVQPFSGQTLGLADYDLILSKQASMYQEGMEKYLADMVKGARNRKYGPTQLSLEI